MAMPTDEASDGGIREAYQRRMLELRAAFEQGASGRETLAGRSAAVDALVRGLWREAVERDPRLGKSIALVAVGGYGRGELYPYSDIDLLFLLESKAAEKDFKDPIRRVSQELWDCGLRVSPTARKLNECERFDDKNVESALALLDHRLIQAEAGNAGASLFERLNGQVLPKLLEREHAAIERRLAELTVQRHAKYGGTLFHLEPNIKEYPGGLRDVHVCGWLPRLRPRAAEAQGAAAGPGTQGEGGVLAALDADGGEFEEAVAFLERVRCFLHYRHERDDNTLDWQAQDAAAAAAIGIGLGRPVDAGYWMRSYFRHARAVDRRTAQFLEDLTAREDAARAPLSRLARLAGGRGKKREPIPSGAGYRVEHGVVMLDAPGFHAPDGFAPGGFAAGASPNELRAIDVAHDPEVVLPMFAAMARSGYRLSPGTEQRLSQALPLLSAHLEEGPVLWRHLSHILTGRYAGSALRAMHALGILELLIPEFHGIDALVIRDAYHRYTVDEHTFVLIDTLHGLEALEPVDLRGQAGGQSGGQAAGQATNTAAMGTSGSPMVEWSGRFAQVLRDLQQPALLYLAALLHDTGKGRSSIDHTGESVRLAESVLARLELDPYECEMVQRLIAGHLEMSAALRRDIFDTDTVRAFAGKVQANEALRMLTLFTYADINAVHPNALSPWKAENLWRLYLATANYLDRSVDEERVGVHRENEFVHRVTAELPEQRAEVEAFLDGLPERYLRTRKPEQVRTHFAMAAQLEEDPVRLDFRYSPSVNELTLVTWDRPLLFANIAGALAAWGMNILTADAFSNRHGVVVDSFRFTDSFRTLEMNASERERFVESVHDVVTGAVAVEKLLHGRRRGRGKAPMVRVEARVDFDDAASSQSTLVQVVAQDTPGLLRGLSLALAGRECNIEVALVDTEGEMAIDVFYLTKQGTKLDAGEKAALREALLESIASHSSGQGSYGR
jgi:[protein-PII] uridylyltransferase